MDVAYDAVAIGHKSSGASTAASISASRQQAQRDGQVRRSSLINVAADDPLANYHSYSEASSAAASPLHSHQATLSRPTTSTLSLQQLLQQNNHCSTSSARTSTLLTAGKSASRPETLLTKARRHTLAGDYRTLTQQLAEGTSSHISDHATAAGNGIGASETTAQLSQLNLVPTIGTTLSTSNHTPGHVVPVPSGPSRSRPESTSIRTSKQTPEPPHIPPRLPHTQSEPQVHAVHDPYVPRLPSSPIRIPILVRDSDHPGIPLTARPRAGLPPVQDQLLETLDRHQQRLALLPYYTNNETIPRPSSRASLRSCHSYSSLSSRSSGPDLPAGALSPFSTKAKDDRSRDGHRRCPSSPSRKRLSRRSARRLAAHNQAQQAKPPETTQMRTSSTTSGIAYTPTSSLSPGPPRSLNAVMQQNRNAGARSRKPQPEFQIPLPRFHPAVYVSPSTSQASTAANSPRTMRTPHGLQPPMSPRAQRHSDQAKAALLETYNELVRATGASGALPLSQELPGTPSLAPARSPGEATPLNLEDGPGDYLTAGAARRGQHAGAVSQRDLVERMILEEEQRRKGTSSVPSSAPVSPSAGN